jgi:hypothetical protein
MSNHILRRSRRGITYIIVLLTSLLVATIALSGLQLVRSYSKTIGDSSDYCLARSYARSAVDIGMLKIRNDPYWRNNLGNGTWVNGQAIGAGKFSLSAVDPIDGDVKNGDNHPIILTATGTSGASTYMTSVRLEVGPRIGSCLEVSMISGNDSNVNSATLTSDQTVSANGQYSANNATVNADVEAFKSINGTTYAKSKTVRVTARDLPDPTSALTYYTQNGTTINYSDLPLTTQPAEMITNGKFETDISGWYVTGGGTAALQWSSAQYKEGAYSLLVKTRTNAATVAAQDLPVSSLANGNTYNLSFPILPSNTGTAQAVLKLTSTGDGVQTFAAPLVTLAKDVNTGQWVWQDLGGTITPTWSGTLTQATVTISISTNKQYYMDKISMTDTTFPRNIYVIDRQLLSPSNNPYGSHQTNAKGIYIINCNGKDVVVGRCRIVGTLVFMNPGHNSLIQGPVCWEPAVYNFPALLANDALEVGCNSSQSLSEATLGLNLNPTGTPYPYLSGVANADTADAYPCKMWGLFYTVKDWTFSAAPNISGLVIADGKINVTANSLTLSYNNTYLNDPPPGFNVGTITMQTVPGTWQRKVN